MELPKELLNKTVVNSKESEIYERMRDAAFKAVKGIIEYEKLYNDLTKEDLHKLAHALAANWFVWCKWLQHVDKQKSKNHD